MKVRDVIKLFEEFPSEADVGFVGHFGEFVQTDEYTFRLHGPISYAVMKHGNDIVEINCPDFGDPPD